MPERFVYVFGLRFLHVGRVAHFLSKQEQPANAGRVDIVQVILLDISGIPTYCK
jgi:hypothetical protein